MNIPKLERSPRKREYDKYSTEQHRNVVIAYLFHSMSHRQIDAEVLGLNSSYSHGYQSMGILHYLGLKKSFKGFFQSLNIESAIQELHRSHNSDYDNLIAILQGCETIQKE